MTAEHPHSPRPQGCTSALFFETRKHKDLYIWLARTPGGPSVKFHVTNGGWVWVGACAWQSALFSVCRAGGDERAGQLVATEALW